MNPCRLVYVSGWGTDEHAWAGVLDSLGGEIFCRHVPWWDCLTSRAEDSALARCLAEDDTPAVVAAWSLGVLAALPVLAAGASPVVGAVLVAGSARMPSDEGYPGTDSRLMKAMRLRIGRNRTAVLEQFARLCAAPNDAPAFVSGFVRHSQSIPEGRLEEGLRYLEERDVRGVVHGIQTPAIVLHGECDRIVPVENGRWLADNMPSAEFMSVPRAGHALLHERPGLVGAAIRRLADAR